MLGTIHIILVMEYRLMFQSLCGIVIFNMVNNTGPKITHKTTSGHGYEGFSIGWSLGMLMRVALLRLAVLGRPTMDIPVHEMGSWTEKKCGSWDWGSELNKNILCSNFLGHNS